MAASRIAIFIDGGYLAKVLRDEFESARIDFGALSENIAGGIDILRTYYYDCLPYQSSRPTPTEKERYGNHRRFLSALERIPRFQVRLGKLAFRGKRADGSEIFEQRQVDILLGVDMVLLAAKHQITHAALVSGDSDFLPAVKAAKDEGVLISLFHGTKLPPHRELWDNADERSTITWNLVNSIRLP